MLDFRHEQGRLQDQPRFAPDPSVHVEELARRYLDATGRCPFGYTLVERTVPGFFELVVAL